LDLAIVVFIIHIKSNLIAFLWSIRKVNFVVTHLTLDELSAVQNLDCLVFRSCCQIPTWTAVWFLRTHPFFQEFIPWIIIWAGISSDVKTRCFIQITAIAKRHVEGVCLAECFSLSYALSNTRTRCVHEGKSHYHLTQSSQDN
jgi:hypothetical protein